MKKIESPFEAYHLFLSIKQHFTRENYDCFKYNFRVNAKASSFNSRKDKYHYYKLSKQQDPTGLIVSNIIEDTSIWIGDLFNDKSKENHTQWLSRQQSISYLFQNEIENISDLKESVLINNGDYPLLLNLFLRKKISHETMIILNSFGKFLPYWKKNISDTIIWPEHYLVLKKYSPFVNFNSIKCKKILLDHMSNV